MAYELPPLPYDYAALEPYIDEATMKLHHDKHHQAYVTNLNGAIDKHPDLGLQIPRGPAQGPRRHPRGHPQRRPNNGGGHVNHTMFWQIMKPAGGGEPNGDIAAQIKADFGDFESFKKLFNETTAKQFGSGWGWLVFEAGKLKIVTTANQDNPLSERPLPHPRQRRLGARLLPEVQQPPPRLPRRLVEHRQLGRDQQALRHRQELQVTTPGVTSSTGCHTP